MTPTHILVVDPCPDNRKSLAQLLGLHGFAAEPIDSIETLLGRLAAGPADVVVTEVFADPAHTWRQVHAAAPGVAVAFHTTRAHAADVRCSGTPGCPHFLKPTGVEPLLAWLAASGADPGDSPGHNPGPTVPHRRAGGRGAVRDRRAGGGTARPIGLARTSS